MLNKGRLLCAIRRETVTSVDPVSKKNNKEKVNHEPTLLHIDRFCPLTQSWIQHCTVSLPPLSINLYYARRRTHGKLVIIVAMNANGSATFQQSLAGELLLLAV